MKKELDYNAQEFIDLEDNAARVQMMSFHLAEYYYQEAGFFARQSKHTKR